MRVFGIILIVLGVLALVYQGITYTTKEEIVDAGPIDVTTTKKETVPLPPIIGGLALAIGVALVVAGGGRRHAA